MAKPRVGLLYEVTVFDKDGKKIKTVKGESKSWVANMGNLLRGVFAGEAAGCRKENGSDALVLNTAGQGDFDGAKVMDGSSDLAGDVTWYSMGTKEGEAVATVTLPYREGNTVKFDITGVITHSTEVVIKEIGLAVMVKENFSGVTSTFLVARDVLPSPITVPAGGGLTVKYTPYVSY
ncbi:MAG: hypothetical protein QW734_11305 [Candidatus Bathyarchaeia archaeon]